MDIPPGVARLAWHKWRGAARTYSGQLQGDRMGPGKRRASCLSWWEKSALVWSRASGTAGALPGPKPPAAFLRFSFSYLSLLPSHTARGELRRLRRGPVPTRGLQPWPPKATTRCESCESCESVTQSVTQVASKLWPARGDPVEFVVQLQGKLGTALGKPHATNVKLQSQAQRQFATWEISIVCEGMADVFVSYRNVV